VRPEDLATVLTALDALLAKDNTQKRQAVFAAAVPLVQGQLTVSKVEALLESARGSRSRRCSRWVVHVTPRRVP
jgi:hypothetical protein